MAHNDLGNALASQGRFDEAMAHYQAALRVDPTLVLARHNLGNIYMDKGQPLEAMREYEQALQVAPDFSPSLHALVKLLLQRGETSRAIDVLNKTLRHNPQHGMAHASLGMIYSQADQPGEAIEHLTSEVRLDPEAPAPRIRLAWLLATHPDPAVRDGKRALPLARRACELTNYRHPVAMDALAAAHAELGEFEQAHQLATEAANLAAAAGVLPLAQAIRERAAGYAAGQPHHTARPRLR